MKLRSLFFSFIFILCLFSCSYEAEGDFESLYLQEENSDYKVYHSGEHLAKHLFFFVPGGLVEPDVYECWIDPLVEADSSIAVVLIQYASNLAIMNQGKVMRVTEKFDQEGQWFLGGHSLGGVVSSTVVDENRGVFSGLVLLASWPREANDLSDWDGAVLSISASEDMLSTSEEIEQNKAFLPEGTVLERPAAFPELENCSYFYEIEGGNHSGFGCYGLQKDDGEASITTLEQQTILIELIQAFISSF